MYKSRKNKLLINTLILTVVLLIVLMGIIFLNFKKLKEADAAVEAYAQELSQNQKIVYVATRNIAPGEQLFAEEDDETKNNVMTQEIYTGLTADNYISSDNLGNIAILPIKKGMPLLSNMVSPLMIDQDTREYEISVANLMIDQKENDYVDIRIMYPNGEDYLVLSKKPIKDLHLDACVFFSYLSEEEILRMASATVDAFTMTGAKLYATRYVATGLQEEAHPNYLVRAETIDLLQSDPNVLTIAKETLNAFARTDLERRMGQLTEEQLAAVAEGHNIADTAQNSVLTSDANATQEELSEEESVEGEAAEEETAEGGAAEEAVIEEEEVE